MFHTIAERVRKEERQGEDLLEELMLKSRGSEAPMRILVSQVCIRKGGSAGPTPSKIHRSCLSG